MKLISDLHIHSRFSRACSKHLNITNLEKWARVKGVHLMGTGDFCQPDWQREIKKDLKEKEKGIYRTKTGFPFILSNEISLMYSQGGKGRRVHLVLLSPNIEVVDQITDYLKSLGRVDYDGRPIFGRSCIEITEKLKAISKDIEIIPAHCLLPTEAIHTNNGMIPISKLINTNYVLTHKGNYKKVKKVLRRKYSGEVIGMNPACHNVSTFVTPEHPIYIIKSFKDCKNLSHTICKPTCSYLKRGCKDPRFEKYKPEWVMASQVEKGDISVFPIYKKVKNVEHIDLKNFVSSKFYSKKYYITPRKERIYEKNIGIKRRINVSKDFCRLMGYYLAEGYATRDYVGFSFHKNESYYINDVKCLLKKIFGNYIKIKETKRSINELTITVYSKILSDFFKMFYSKKPYRSYNKYIPKFMLDLPPIKQKEIFIGWWRGDIGCTTSIDLINQMKIILLRLKIIPTINLTSAHSINKRRIKTPNKINGRKIIAKHDVYNIGYLCFFDKNLDLLELREFKKFKSKLSRRKGYFDNNYVYLPITKIIKRKYSGYVYNLEVKDDNSYITENLAVHNCWTPWFGALGSKSGFDSLEEAFGDQIKHIYSYETGLSSDPPMNWRVSGLDKFSILSFSDAHSFWPWRLGRESTLFDLPKLNYKNLIKAIRTKKGLEGTIELNPAYGKYHWDGHRNCGVVLTPKQTRKAKGICPKCNRPLTIGVEYRVEELADRPMGAKPKNAKKFQTILPLSDLISTIYGPAVSSKTVWGVYNKMIKAFGNEYDILLNVEKNKLKQVNEKIVDIILKNREGKIKVKPGFDGVYGKAIFNSKEVKMKKEKTLKDFG